MKQVATYFNEGNDCNERLMEKGYDGECYDERDECLDYDY